MVGRRRRRGGGGGGGSLGEGVRVLTRIGKDYACTRFGLLFWVTNILRSIFIICLVSFIVVLPFLVFNL